MEGPEGIKKTGNKAKETTRTMASIGRPKAVASHCRIGIKTYNQTNTITLDKTVIERNQLEIWEKKGSTFWNTNGTPHLAKTRVRTRASAQIPKALNHQIKFLVRISDCDTNTVSGGEGSWGVPTTRRTYSLSSLMWRTEPEVSSLGSFSGFDIKTLGKEEGRYNMLSFATSKTHKENDN